MSPSGAPELPTVAATPLQLRVKKCSSAGQCTFGTQCRAHVQPHEAPAALLHISFGAAFPFDGSFVGISPCQAVRVVFACSLFDGRV